MENNKAKMVPRATKVFLRALDSFIKNPTEDRWNRLSEIGFSCRTLDNHYIDCDECALNGSLDSQKLYPYPPQFEYDGLCDALHHLDKGMPLSDFLAKAIELRGMLQANMAMKPEKRVRP